MGRKNWFLFGFANDDISSDGAVGWRSKIVKMITPLSLPFYIALFSVTLVIFLHSYCQAIIISMQHLDGAYQTFSALDRIAHGQAFGKDFFSYLGIGVMYSLYPVFMVLGKNVFASTFAAFLLAKITALFSLFTLVYFGFLGRLSKKASLLLAIIIYSMVVLMLLLQFGLVKHYALPLFISVFQPGNSLYPLRSFIPFIVVWGLYCLLSKSHRSFIWLGLLGCLCLLWSNDFAVPTLIFLFFIYGVYNFAFSVVFAKEMLFALFVSLVSYIVLLFVILKGSMWAWFVYNYQGVLKDQGWYFAPYSASFRYFSLEHFLVFWKGRGPCYFPLLLAIPMLLGLFCYAVKKKNLYAYLIVFLGGVSLFAGMLSEIAGHISNHYYSRYIQVYYFMFIPFVLIALQFLPIKKAMAKVASYFRKTLKLRIKYYKNLLLYGLSVLVTVALVIFVIYASSKFITRIRGYHSSAYVYVASLGGYVPKNFESMIEYAQHESLRNGSKYSALATYYGPYQASIRSPHVTKLDSIIHVLGSKTRENYYSFIKRRRFSNIVTTIPTNHWQRWNLFQNWEFYRYTIINYKPVAHFTSIVVWVPRRHPLHVSSTPLACQVVNNNTSHVKLRYNEGFKSSDLHDLFEITLRYNFVFKKSFVPIIGSNKLLVVNMPTKLSKIYTTFSISPYMTIARFPLVPHNEDMTVYLNAYPSSRSKIRVSSCMIKRVTPLDKSFYVSGRLHY